MRFLMPSFVFILFTTSGFYFLGRAGIPNQSGIIDWELRKDKDGIQVFTRNYQNSEIKEFKAVTVLQTDLDTLVKILKDIDKYPFWMANCKSALTYEVINDSTRIDYMTTAVPWPLNDRDVVFKFMIIKQSENYFEAILKAIPDRVPEEKKFVRIRNSEGRWTFTKIEHNKIEVVHQFFGEPEGSIPGWIVNMFIVHGPYQTLSNLRDRCQK